VALWARWKVSTCPDVMPARPAAFPAGSRRNVTVANEPSALRLAELTTAPALTSAPEQLNVMRPMAVSCGLLICSLPNCCNGQQRFYHLDR
jgi:hypothetical protein